MELVIYAPKEDGFIKAIDWNFEELKAEITAKAEEYMNLVYSDSQIKEAKKDRADLNKFKKALEDKRKDVKSQVMNPYTVFEAQIKELVGIIEKAADNIDAQVKGFEEEQRRKKEEICRKLYEEHIGDLGHTIPFEKVFNPKWLNKTYSEKTIIEDITSLYDKVDRELKLIGMDMSPYIFEMKEEYLKDYDMSAAMAVKQRLEETEKKKAMFAEKERQRKEEEEKRIAEEAQAVQSAGSAPTQEIRVNENGEPVVVEASPEKTIRVTLRVTAHEAQFGSLNDVIRELKAIVGTENVEMLNKEVL